MTTEPRDVHAEVMAALGGRNADAPPAQSVEPPADAGQAVAAPWGSLHADPQEQLSALSADPKFQEALLHAEHPAHSLAVKQRSDLFAAIHGTERGDVPAGSGSGDMDPRIHEGYMEPAPEEMRAAYANTATGILEQHGVDHETALGISQIAIGAGLSTLDVSDVAQAIAGSREYSSPEAGVAELGDNAAETIRLAQQQANALQLPQELLDLPVSEHLVLGEHPRFIEWLAKRGR